MKSKNAAPTVLKNPENPRSKAVKRILGIAQLVRQRGTPEEAEEAVEWEKRLQERMQQLDRETVSQAA